MTTAALTKETFNWGWLTIPEVSSPIQVSEYFESHWLIVSEYFESHWLIVTRVL